MTQLVKNPPAMQETQIQSLGLEKEMATHFCILACKIPWTERSLVGYSPRGRKESPTTLRLNHRHHHQALLSSPAKNSR